MAQDYAAEGEDMYSDTPATVAPPEAEAFEEAPEGEVPEETEADGEEQTALLPKGVFMGKPLTPGTRCEIEVVRVHDDEVEVKYIPHSKSTPEKAAAAPPASPPPMDEMASLME